MLEKIKMSKSCIRKSAMTSGNEYRVYLSYNGKKCSLSYHDNYLNKVEKSNVIYCLLMDAMAYESSMNFDDFCNEFGYSTGSITDTLKAYKGCKKNYDKVHRLFSESEIEILLEETE